MRRREVIAGLAGTAMCPPHAVAQPIKVPRIGYLGFGTTSAWTSRIEAMCAGLRDLGYSEGKNILIEFRFAENLDQLRERATELARMKSTSFLRPHRRRWERPERRPKQSRSCSRPMPIQSALGMWRAYPGPEATSPA